MLLFIKLFSGNFSKPYVFVIILIMAKQAPKKKGANGYKLPDPLPKNEILVDLAKKKWKLGTSIGQGGFGEIYSAQEADTKSANYPYVVKIEPHENGPLFVEINFYIRNAKAQDVEDFKNTKKLKTIGMPIYLGSGSHEYKNQKYRFLVMPKFGTDIWKLFLENGKAFPVTTVFKLGVQILDVIEFIHSRGYVHADIKGANILIGSSKDTQSQTYLVDFGLATKYQTGGEFKPNPKKAHDGTIEYLSRDAHRGVPTRRGDLEILAYNLIQWLGCILPWESNLTNPVKVQESKEQNMSDINKFLKSCFGSKTIPAAMTEFLKYINSLKFDAKPDYAKIRKMFVAEIEKNGQKLASPLAFSNGKPVSPSKRKNESKKTNTKKLKAYDEKEEEDCKMNGTQKNEEQIKTKKIKPKITKEVSEEGEFDGYTPEMKAIALKKQNGAKNAVRNTKKQKDSPVKSLENCEPNLGRSKRNIKPINYSESSPKP
ncbi:hypothetical protein HHI36_015809 [Cryptolaemus montrouzieri]|uniref:non-specific serine/threonine protein kinase n=1 Tax=Cryptolaemus montrouzieri TaxID=559131 RepID=A0ABD2N737_9CUCU